MFKCYEFYFNPLSLLFPCIPYPASCILYSYAPLPFVYSFVCLDVPGSHVDGLDSDYPRPGKLQLMSAEMIRTLWKITNHTQTPSTGHIRTEYSVEK